MKKHTNGFTVIEILFVTVLVATASILFFIQKNSLEIAARDNARKTAINAMYYSLEEVFYPANEYYPQSINSDNLKSMDPTLFTDPTDIMINTSGSSYTYTPANCVNEKCKSYTLKATLENEGDFIKTNKR
ncbi:MAG: hypothetical protein PWQ10_2 [Patescibacteria group bacterium]|nr:hypothetical protein [Patescibacteria group bacterium]